MTRVLRRPMFRLGGNTDQGIMSGVVPRQGYATDQEGGSVQSLGDLRNLTIPQLRELSKSMAYQPRGTTPADALIEFGLNVASAEPKGSIFSTAAESAKEPFQRYSKSKAESAAAKYVSEADMFKTLIGAQADVLGSEGGGKTYADLEKIKKIEGIMKEQFDIQRQVEAGDLKPTDILPDHGYSANERLAILSKSLNNLVKKDPAVASALKIPQLTESLYATIVEELSKKIDPETNRPVYKSAEDPALIKEAYRQYLEYFGVAPPVTISKATGGRVGYQQGMSVMPTAMPTAMPAQEDAMPEELGGISYEELRARLPQEVSDEVVRLLANSPEALEDFAVIQTEQDIANFNKKYGVNLVLPAEG